MKINQIKLNDVANGDGISISVWSQGCPHHCKGCFNPDTWSFDTGEEYSEKTLEYIFDNIDKNNIKRNLSVLGGEPLCPQNVEGCIDLCISFKKRFPHRKIYLWTGYVVEKFNSTQREILSYIDVLVDGEFEIDKKDLTLNLKGSKNQRVIDVQKSLQQNKTILYK